MYSVMSSTTRSHLQGEENAVVATSDAAAQQSIAQRRGTLQNLNFTVADPADHCETCVESYRGRFLVCERASMFRCRECACILHLVACIYEWTHVLRSNTCL